MKGLFLIRDIPVRVFHRLMHFKEYQSQVMCAATVQDVTQARQVALVSYKLFGKRPDIKCFKLPMEESCIARGSGLSCLDALRRKVRHKIVLHSSHYPERHHQLTLESAAGSLDLLVSCSKSMVLEKGQKR
ncbi:hypothetical protein Dsin_014004 [Dipteronia sinensis]|uniref:Uncharacterized protein n=1 Tax=Dipteronia sinensis TaxID=43782 RepID=A0AAE0AM94_9ROSI|nr:hypothetical protein Dsin_014004 [Dipteronia sinensis]